MARSSFYTEDWENFGTLSDDPFPLFDQWYQKACETEPRDANAMALATVDESGLCDVRIVLLKEASCVGFVFYTNTESAKGQHLSHNPKAALCFYWKSQARQVRIRGVVESVSDKEADAYFATRPRGSQIGAWASRQSRTLDTRAMLEEAVKTCKKTYENQAVPRPGHWSGYLLRPESVEFWQEGRFRLHDRLHFMRLSNGEWERRRLSP